MPGASCNLPRVWDYEVRVVGCKSSRFRGFRVSGVLGVGVGACGLGFWGLGFTVTVNRLLFGVLSCKGCMICRSE